MIKSPGIITFISHFKEKTNMVMFIQIFPFKQLSYEQNASLYSWSKTSVNRQVSLYHYWTHNICVLSRLLVCLLFFYFCILYSVRLPEPSHSWSFLNSFFLEELSRTSQLERAYDRTSPIKSQYNILLIRTNTGYFIRKKSTVFCQTCDNSNIIIQCQEMSQ